MRSMRSDFAIGALALGISVCIFAGCVTDPYTGEQKVSKTAIGAVIGAAAGAGIGAIASEDGERGKNAAIGAGVGALAGGAVGYYMDRQEAKLRERLQGTGVSVTRDGDNLILNMPGNVTFETNRAEVKADFYAVLNSVSLVLDEFDKTVIHVTGHTDDTGTDAHNQDLSERRARTVGAYLEAQGIVTARVVMQGFGESRPIATNDTPKGRSQNRRVELTLVPISK